MTKFPLFPLLDPVEEHHLMVGRVLRLHYGVSLDLVRAPLPRIMCPLLDGTMNILVTQTASETLDSYPQSSSVNYISIRYPLQIANLYVKPFWGSVGILR
jgi:hypothetical protein